MNTAANIEMDSSSAEFAHGERYFVARTSSGVCAVNYPPEDERYIGGPFMTWDGAYAYIRVYRTNLRVKWIQRSMWLASSAAVLTLTLMLASWLA